MNNPIETSAKQFYIHQSDVQVYYQVYLMLENWIANNIFREDKSRVFLASNAYAFRKRFELTDMHKDYEQLQPSALQFPFANYWPMNTGWKPDTRMAANPASMLYQGITIGNTLIRASMVSNSIPVTFYFDREDDARFAYNILHFYSFNEHYLDMPFMYGGSSIGIPLAFKFSNLKFNPEYNESNWLKQNRIFTISTSVDLRTYIVFPPKQPSFKYELGPNGNLVDASGNPVGDYDDGIEVFELTEEVILNFKAQDAPLREYLITGTVDESSVYVNKMNAIIDPSNFSEVTLNWIIETPGTESYDSNPNRIISITYNINNSPVPEIIDINDCKVEEIDFNKREFFYTLKGLKGDSAYNLYINLTSASGATKRVFLGFKTSPDPEVISKVETPKDALVGIKW